MPEHMSERLTTVQTVQSVAILNSNDVLPEHSHGAGVTWAALCAASSSRRCVSCSAVRAAAPAPMAAGATDAAAAAADMLCSSHQNQHCAVSGLLAGIWHELASCVLL